MSRSAPVEVLELASTQTNGEHYLLITMLPDYTASDHDHSYQNHEPNNYEYISRIIIKKLPISIPETQCLTSRE
jgi:hypothetical protein